MKDDKGKVIFSLIAGATAGIVAGLLLAPETGDETRSGLRKSAAKWSDDLSKLAKDTLAKVTGQPATSTPDTAMSEDKEAADRLLHGLNKSTTGAESAALTTPATSEVAASEPGDLSTPAATGSASVAGNGTSAEHLTQL